MEEEFGTALVLRMRQILDGVTIAERTAVYKQGGPTSGQVTYNVEYPAAGSPNNQLIGVVVDLDIWYKGPDATQAEKLASDLESGLVNWSVNTLNQGTVRLIRFSRAYMTDEVEKLAHITMRLTGRAFRRL